MDVRVLWLSDRQPEPALLELLVCSGIIGAMIGVALHGMHHLWERLHVLEAVSLATSPEIDMTEYRAVTGTWPVANERATIPAPGAGMGLWVATEVLRGNGAVDFEFSARADGLAGKTLTIRAWHGADAGDVPTVWLCGHARGASMIAAGEDRTTLGDDELPSPCRRHD